MVGNQDILTPRGDSEELAELIPTAELVVISGAAHGLMIEHASTFNRVLLDFLGRAELAYDGQAAVPGRRAGGLTLLLGGPPGLSPVCQQTTAMSSPRPRSYSERWFSPARRRNSENDSAATSVASPSSQRLRSITSA